MALTAQQKKVYAIGGIAVGGTALVLYLYEQNKKKTAATAAAAAASAAQTQQASQYAYGYGYASAGYGYGYSNYIAEPEVYGYGLGYYGYGTSTGTVVTPAVTTNAMWSQAAVTQLTNQGQNGETVQAALGVYLTGGQLTATQESIVQSAIAVEGYPPQPGANGYPPAMNVNASTGQSSTSSTTTSPTTGATSTQQTYTTVGGKTLSQIATQLGTNPETIVSMTAATDYNKGKAWPYLDNWNKVIPAGIILVY
jgi:hypothetical protein